MQSQKKGIIGILLTLTSLVLLVAAFVTQGHFKPCAVPMGYWNIFFTLVLLAIGCVYLLNDFAKLSENTMAWIVRCTMIFMIIVFLWGDFFLMLTLIDSPKCISFVMMVIYLITMFLGTIVAIIEGFSIMKSVVE